MAVSVAAALQSGPWPPRVLVTVTGVASGGTTDVFRRVGGVDTILRAGRRRDSPASFVVVDAEFPFGVPVTYYVETFLDGTATDGPHTYELPGGKVALSDAITGLSAEVMIMSWPEIRRPRQSTVFVAGGRNVAVQGPLGQWTGQAELFVETTSSLDNLTTLLEQATAGIVQIRQPGGYDGVDSYVAVTEMTVRRFSQDGSDQRRLVLLDMAQVDPWGTTLEARGYTYDDLAAAYSGQTYATLAADHATYLALQQAEF